jgi:hypothetical protein
MKFLGAVLLAASLAVGTVSLAAAQYPPAGAAITVTPSDPTPDVGETVTVTFQVSGATSMNVAPQEGPAILASMPAAPRDAANSASAAAGPYTCASSVSGGVGATVSPSTVTTDANGVGSVSVYTGTAPAILTVAITCGSGASAQAQLVVGGGGQTPASPTPGRGGTVPQPPSTGSAQRSAPGGDTAPWFAAIGLGLVAVAGAGYVVARRSRSNG